MLTKIWTIVLLLLSAVCCLGQNHSVARQWNEVLLEAIRNDLARPTVHARNLFHVSAAMYDAWAVFTPGHETYFLGEKVGGFFIPFEGFSYEPEERRQLQEEAMSYTAYRLMQHRFRNSPGFQETSALMDGLMDELGFDRFFFDMDYAAGSAAALGNYIADRIKAFGLQDGANELGDYGNQYYEPVNEPLPLVAGGPNLLQDPNRWQPLQFDQSFIDQSGNVIETGTIDFLSPEWGDVAPFSFTDKDRGAYTRDEHVYQVYKDPGPPPLLDTLRGVALDDPYKWGFALVSIWSAHLDPADGVMMDISPRSIGHIEFDQFPDDYQEYDQFYDLLEGGDISPGYEVNPHTGAPYEPQMVPRGDYGRVLAEFWADGPDSETPPGHWYTILNYVSDHPSLEKKLRGQGAVLDPLEWDVKAYFILGGAMHDAAIAAWSVKGYYDYIRPISAIRYMATMGQSSDPDKPNYHKAGLPLVPGYIELIEAGDSLAGEQGEHLNKLKVYAWRGHDFIDDAETDQAGVGWILAENWWPYQRPSFVTPPFAGYVSGHSTYSRAAAEVLTLLTGDEYFPGGMGEFVAKKNEFLVFEKGPSVDVVLQWAKYYDASDQCSLSRIWGGIHPPADDIPGRKMGRDIGRQAFAHAIRYFDSSTVDVREPVVPTIRLFPNPAGDYLQVEGVRMGQMIRISNSLGRMMYLKAYDGQPISLQTFPPGVYFVTADGATRKLIKHKL